MNTHNLQTPMAMPHQRRRAASYALAAFALLAAVASAETFNVRVVDYEYDPKILTVAPGDTVVWTAYGMDHSVTADNGEFDSAITLPEPSIPVFGTFSVTFPNPGTYPYHCVAHGGPGGIGMAGVIRVMVPGQNHPPAKPSNTAPSAGAISVSKTPLLQASAFVDEDAGDSHAASQWLIRKVSDGSTVLDSGEDSTNKLSFRPTILNNSVEYEWQVRYKDAAGAWSEYSDATRFTTIAEQTAEGTGLKGSYGSYNSKKGIGTVLTTRIDPVVDFDWKIGKAAPKTPANNFYAKWEGSVLPDTSELYRFRIVADGGVRLSINGHVVIDDWDDTKFPIYRSGVAQLEAGVKANIVLEYYDTAGKASVKLRWVTATKPLEVIPQAKLFPPAN